MAQYGYYSITLYHCYLIVSRGWSCPPGSTAPHPRCMLYNPPNLLGARRTSDLATKEMLVDALKDFEGTTIFVSHDRMFLRGLG